MCLSAVLYAAVNCWWRHVLDASVNNEHHMSWEKKKGRWRWCGAGSGRGWNAKDLGDVFTDETWEGTWGCVLFREGAFVSDPRLWSHLCWIRIRSISSISALVWPPVHLRFPTVSETKMLREEYIQYILNHNVVGYNSGLSSCSPCLPL